jgi:hypothetical protein
MDKVTRLNVKMNEKKEAVSLSEGDTENVLNDMFYAKFNITENNGYYQCEITNYLPETFIEGLACDMFMSIYEGRFFESVEAIIIVFMNIYLEKKDWLDDFKWELEEEPNYNKPLILFDNLGQILYDCTAKKENGIIKYYDSIGHWLYNNGDFRWFQDSESESEQHA